VRAIVVKHVVTAWDWDWDWNRDCDSGWREVARGAGPFTMRLRGSSGPAKASRVLDASAMITLP
jgi:hypothetical protein